MVEGRVDQGGHHHHGEHKDKREAYRLPPPQIDRIGQRRSKGNAEADRVHEKHCKGYHHSKIQKIYYRVIAGKGISVSDKASPLNTGYGSQPYPVCISVARHSRYARYSAYSARGSCSCLAISPAIS